MTDLAPVRAQTIKPKISRDDWAMRAFMVMIGLYLLISLAFPLYAMLSKSFETYGFDLAAVEFQVNKGEGWGETLNASDLNASVGAYGPAEMATSNDGRLAVTKFFPDFSFRSETLYRLRTQDPIRATFLVAGKPWRKGTGSSSQATSFAGFRSGRPRALALPTT